MNDRTVIRRRNKTGQPPLAPVPPALFVAPPFPTQLRPGYRSGHCRIDAPPESHLRCKGTQGSAAKPATCVCECHDYR